MTYPLRLALLVLSTVLCTGCHWFDDPATIADCPTNSQFPCPCTTSCDGDNICVVSEGAQGSYGQCTLKCYGENRVCEVAAAGFGTGVCLSDGMCAMACRVDDDCPAGMGCLLDICTPGLRLDSEVASRLADTDSDTAGQDTASTPDSSSTDTDSSSITDTATDTNTDTATTDGTDSATDSDSAPIDTDTVDEVVQALRKAECTSLSQKLFDCNPEDQPYTFEEYIEGCIINAWHDTPCGQCQLSCDRTLSCAQWSACLVMCDVCLQSKQVILKVP